MKDRIWWIACACVLGFGAPLAADGPELNPSSPWYLADSDRRWRFDAFLGAELEPDYIGSDDGDVRDAPHAEFGEQLLVDEHDGPFHLTRLHE